MITHKIYIGKNYISYLNKYSVNTFKKKIRKTKIVKKKIISYYSIIFVTYNLGWTAISYVLTSNSVTIVTR